MGTLCPSASSWFIFHAAVVFLEGCFFVRASDASATTVNGDRKGWGTLSTFHDRDGDDYFRLIRTDYRERVRPNYLQYTIVMRVDPCKDFIQTGGLGFDCCTGTIEGCQHHPEVRAGLDMQIAYFINAHIPNCKGTPFEDDPNCGTYIELHRPDDPTILGDVAVDSVPFPSGYRTTRIATHRCCLGTHELWWVVRTRSGPYVQRKQPFFVTGPSCSAPVGAAVLPPEASLPPPAIP